MSNKLATSGFGGSDHRRDAGGQSSELDLLGDI
jgi:hypothetical protein